MGKLMIEFTNCHLVAVTSMIVARQSCGKIACSIALCQNVAPKYLRLDVLRRRSCGNVPSDSQGVAYRFE